MSGTYSVLSLPETFGTMYPIFVHHDVLKKQAILVPLESKQLILYVWFPLYGMLTVDGVNWQPHGQSE